MNTELVDQFIASYAVPPKENIVDFDATDDVVHGNQEGRFFHGCYDHYCVLPPYVFCGSQLLCAYLRPWAKHALLTKPYTAGLAGGTRKGSLSDGVMALPPGLSAG